jgi:tetratricopeptide (TPR) repeat protein
VSRDFATRLSQQLSQFVPHSAPLVLLVLTLAAAVAFAAVSHLVTRFNANQQARGRKLYAEGMADANAHRFDDAIAAFRAALTCDPSDSQYQLSLARALRDSNDPRRLDEAESYLVALWQRTPQDAAVNLALARVAAHRGDIEDATRYYHNAMYGVWNSDSDSNRRHVRIELIQFLLKRNASARAESEIIALAASLPPDPALHLQTAQLFAQVQDYSNALSQYQEVLRLDSTNPVAFAGAGESAYRLSDYNAAERYLRDAVTANPENANSRQLLDSVGLVLDSNPYRSHISDAERNRRIVAAFAQAGNRLTECAQQLGIDLNPSRSGGQSGSVNPPLDSADSSASPLLALQLRWSAMKPSLMRLRTPRETDLPDSIIDLVFQIEQRTASSCGPPQGFDQALLLISQRRQAAGQ